MFTLHLHLYFDVSTGYTNMHLSWRYVFVTAVVHAAPDPCPALVKMLSPVYNLNDVYELKYTQYAAFGRLGVAFCCFFFDSLSTFM